MKRYTGNGPWLIEIYEDGSVYLTVGEQGPEVNILFTAGTPKIETQDQES